MEECISSAAADSPAPVTEKKENLIQKCHLTTHSHRIPGGPANMKNRPSSNPSFNCRLLFCSFVTVLLMFAAGDGKCDTGTTFKTLRHNGNIRAAINERKPMPVPQFPIRLPAKFDLRSYGRAAPPYKTTNCASCWSSAATYIMESLLMPKEKLDLSETHMQMSQVHECGAGASAEYAAYYLTSWRGPITESDYQRLVLKKGLRVRPRAHVQKVQFIPFRQGPLDNQQIKRYIYYKGPIYASVGWRGITNGANHSYYWPGNSPVHAVALVGWDNHFDRNKFTFTYQGTTYTPDGDGAFIARNIDGNFYFLSYYDGTVGYNLMAVFSAEPVSNYKRIYQYDPYGPQMSICPNDMPGYLPNSGHTSAIYGGNVFSAVQNESLTAIGFFSRPYPGRDQTFDITVYLDPDNAAINSQGAAAEFSVNFSLGGYHTVTLPQPIQLQAHQRFSVVVRGYHKGAPGDFSCLLVEEKPWNTPMSISPSQSYISPDGQTWFDLSSVPGQNSTTGQQEYVYGNLGIKAYTKDIPQNVTKGSPWKSPPVSLTIADVKSPSINCTFDPTCKIVVHDMTTPFTLPGATGNGILQSRVWPVGKPGTKGEGLRAYLYRIDLGQMAGITNLPCVNRMTINFGPVWTLDYNSDGTPEQVFVITQGGLGNVKPSTVKKSGNSLAFEFATPVCAGASVGKGDSSYFFGMASNRSPLSVMAKLHDTTGATQTLKAFAPKIFSTVGKPASPSNIHMKIHSNQ